MSPKHHSFRLSCSFLDAKIEFKGPESLKKIKSQVVVSEIFLFMFIPLFEEMIQFDEHVFCQMG